MLLLFRIISVAVFGSDQLLLAVRVSWQATVITIFLEYLPLHQRPALQNITLLVLLELFLEVVWASAVFHVHHIRILDRGKLFKRFLSLSFDRIEFGWRAH